MLYKQHYWKRFAQSAGPLSKVVVQLTICVGSCLLEFCATLNHFVDKVPPSFGMLFGFYFEPWTSFLEQFLTLGAIFGALCHHVLVLKKHCGAKGAPGSPKRPAPFRSPVLIIILDVCLERFEPMKYSKNVVGSFKIERATLFHGSLGFHKKCP